jgi:hypothetical protein
VLHHGSDPGVALQKSQLRGGQSVDPRFEGKASRDRVYAWWLARNCARCFGVSATSSPHVGLFDSEYELSKAGFTANEINHALTFQKLKNEIIASQDKWDECARARAIAKDKKWFHHQGMDVRGRSGVTILLNSPLATHGLNFSFDYGRSPTLGFPSISW